MKKYLVFHSNNVESNKVAEFDTVSEAKTYCDEQTKGAEPFDGDDGDLCHDFRYEVYDSENFNPEYGFEGNPVYETPRFWEER